ncbi:hypothetical protein COEREDRAFT_90711 [Coemansia reversa NRRL 1564]|uniref:Secreted protein n=1 Tax=Coemansia reversa (strain ATCC 12441 / NRRL 1564) TaxID=763665 RepID=A0A2G5BKW6_COERN|nr:hypothetical protein COEREDRAFT_90711 [Coemansia reversa NRRL 1564]|eukprot:PIA19407.1 hypothetical protein COEREDRAFT_90711 [Coemansia reversa NRRL 1564]
MFGGRAAWLAGCAALLAAWAASRAATHARVSLAHIKLQQPLHRLSNVGARHASTLQPSVAWLTTRHAYGHHNSSAGHHACREHHSKWQA